MSQVDYETSPDPFLDGYVVPCRDENCTIIEAHAAHDNVPHGRVIRLCSSCLKPMRLSVRGPDGRLVYSLHNCRG